MGGQGLGGHTKAPFLLYTDSMMNIEKKIWVERNAHTVPMVCFGTSLDHLVLSPSRAHEIGSLLIEAASDALAVKEDTDDEG
jgi:hypothetical protein